MGQHNPGHSEYIALVMQCGASHCTEDVQVSWPWLCSWGLYTLHCCPTAAAVPPGLTDNLFSWLWSRKSFPFPAQTIPAMYGDFCLLEAAVVGQCRSQDTRLKRLMIYPILWFYDYAKSYAAALILPIQSSFSQELGTIRETWKASWFIAFMQKVRLTKTSYWRLLPYKLSIWLTIGYLVFKISSDTEKWLQK